MQKIEASLIKEFGAQKVATLELLDKLKHNKLFYVPLLFTSEDDCMLRSTAHGPETLNATSMGTHS